MSKFSGNAPESRNSRQTLSVLSEKSRKAIAAAATPIADTGSMACKHPGDLYSRIRQSPPGWEETKAVTNLARRNHSNLEAEGMGRGRKFRRLNHERTHVLFSRRSGAYLAKAEGCIASRVAPKPRHHRHLSSQSRLH
jgi:hypothetical protein